MTEKRKTGFLNDTIINAIAFGLYVLIQQVILILVARRSDGDYTTLYSYLAIFNILINVAGEIGITKMLKKDRGNKDFSLLILFFSLLALFVVSLFIVVGKIFSGQFDLNAISIIAILVLVFLGCFRFYSLAYFRIRLNFKGILLQNLVYFLCASVGIILYIYVFKNFFFLPFLLGEIGSAIYTFITTDVYKLDLEKTDDFKSRRDVFIKLSLVSLTANLVVYADKLAIGGLLGISAMAVYVATATVTKFFSLILNPLSSALFARVSQNEKQEDENLYKGIELKLFLFIAIELFVSLAISILALKLLYPQYYARGVKIIFFVCLASCFADNSSVIRSIVQKDMGENKLLIYYASYLLTFVALGAILAFKFDLMGYAISHLISRFILYLLFITSLIKVKRLKNKKEIVTGNILSDEIDRLNILEIISVKGDKNSGILAVIPSNLNSLSKNANVSLYSVYGVIPCGLDDNIKFIQKDNLKLAIENADVILFEGVYCKEYLQIAKSSNKPYFILPHGMLSRQSQKRKRIKKFFGNLLFFNSFIRKSKGLIYLSYEESDASIFGKDYIVCPNSVNLAVENNNGKNARDNAKEFLFLARKDIRVKGIDRLLKGVLLAKSEFEKNGAKLFLCGTDDLNSKEYIERFVKRYELEQIVILQGGVFGEEKVKLLSRADVFVLTSRSDAMPLGLLEGLSYSLPAIVSNAVGYASDIKRADAGIVCSDEREIANAFIDYMTKNILQEKSKNAKSFINDFLNSDFGRVKVEKISSVIRG